MAFLVNLRRWAHLFQACRVVAPVFVPQLRDYAVAGAPTVLPCSGGVVGFAMHHAMRQHRSLFAQKPILLLGLV
jgi:hypothetical protein